MLTENERNPLDRTAEEAVNMLDADPKVAVSLLTSGSEETILSRLCTETGYKMPAGCYLGADGVRKDRRAGDETIQEQIALRPFVVRRRQRSDRDVCRYEVAWISDTNEVKTRSFTNAEIQDARKFAAAFGELVVHPNHTRSCLDYMSRWIGTNREWLVRHGETVATGLGWPLEGTSTFMSGPERPAPIEDVKNTGGWLQGHRTRGEMDEWGGEIALLRDRPIIQVMITASLAAPLLRIIEAKPFAVDLSGTTTTGKTTALNASASVWGDPRKVLLTWKDTGVAIGHHLAMLRGMPICIDETQLVADPRTVEDIIYGLTEGKSRGRSTRDGSGLQDQDSFESILLTTGESAVTSMTQKGGIVPRVVTMTGQSCVSAEQADRLNGMARRHYGHAGPAFVEALQHLNGDDLRDRYDELCEKLRQYAQGAVSGRRADSVAVLALANELAAQMGLLAALDDEVWAWLVTGGGVTEDGEEDRSRAALRKVVTWAAANPGSFFGHPSGRSDAPVHGGWAGRWEEAEFIAFVPARLRKELEAQGYTDPDQVIRTWRDRGWLKHQPGKLTAPVRMGSSTVKLNVVMLLEDLADSSEALGKTSTKTDQDLKHWTQGL